MASIQVLAWRENCSTRMRVVLRMSESAQLSSVEPAVTPKVSPGRFPTAVWLQIGAVVLLLGLLYWHVIPSLVADWWADPNFSHGFVVPLFSGLMVWCQRRKLYGLDVQPSWWGVLVILGGGSTLVVGVLGAELFLSRSSLIVILAGLIIQFYGWRHFRVVLLPWLFLFLMIPIPTIVFNQITFPLQLLASRLAAWMLAALGIPVLRAGNIIQLASMPLEVAEACSGIRSLTSLLTLALIYGYFLEKSRWRIAALAVAAFPIAVVANSMRIVGTGVAVEYWNPESALGFFHEFSGWVIFIVSLVLLFGTHRLLARIGRSRPEVL